MVMLTKQLYCNFSALTILIHCMWHSMALTFHVVENNKHTFKLYFHCCYSAIFGQQNCCANVASGLSNGNLCSYYHEMRKYNQYHHSSRIWPKTTSGCGLNGRFNKLVTVSPTSHPQVEEQLCLRCLSGEANIMIAQSVSALGHLKTTRKLQTCHK